MNPLGRAARSLLLSAARPDRLRRPRRRPAHRAGDGGRSRHAGLAVARHIRDRGRDHAVHDLLRAPRRPREADAGQSQRPVPGRVVDDVQGRADLGVRPAQGRALPQRRTGHGRGREVQLRALQGRGRAAVQGAGARGPGGGSGPRALPPERAVAGLHDLLRHQRLGRGVDHPQEVLREGRRGWLPQGADRRRALQVRELPAGRGAGAGSLRGVLAEDARA